MEGAPLKGLLGKETWEERGWLPPPPCCWEGACAPPLVWGQRAWNAALLVALPPTSAQGIWPTPGFY